MPNPTRHFLQSSPLHQNDSPKESHQTLRSLILISFFSFLITGCALDDLDILPDILPPKTFTVEYPEEYNATQPVILTQEATAEGAKPIKITYPSDTQTPLKIYFNGQNVSACYAFSDTEATAELYCMREYIRQGTNTISINPQSLLQGLTRTFMLDTAGPQANIQKVCFTANDDCSESSNGNVEVTVNYVDPSNIESTTLNGFDPLSIDGTARTFLVPINDTYTFLSFDSNNTSSEIIYKASGQRINEVAKIRVAEDMLSEFLPLINNQASGMESGQPDGSGDPVLENLTIDIIGIKIGADVKYIKVGKMDMQKLAIADTDPHPLTIDMFMEPLGERDTDWFDQNDTVENTGDVGVEVLLHMRDYTSCFGILCGFPGFTEAVPCPIKGWDRCNYGITINMDMRMYIERIKITSAVDLRVDQGNFDIKLNADNDQNVITLHDVLSNMTGEQTSGAQEQGFIDGIISSPAISGLIKGIVEDTINRNLDEIKLEKTFDFDTGAQMDVSGRVENMRTDGGADDNIGNLTIDLSGIFDTIIPDKSIPPALGSYYVNDQPLPTPEDTGSSLGGVLNANIVNQALLAMYNTGATHLTMLTDNLLTLNSTLHTGLGATDALGNNFNVRAELIPSSPGEFSMHGDTTHQAYLAFRGAEMIISIKFNGTWKTITRLNVDIKAGVKMDVVDGFFTMTIAGTPEYHINHMDDLVIGSSNFGIKIDSATIEALIQKIIEWGVPLVADTHLKIDVSKAGISDKLYTESATSNNGHLNFETSVRNTP